MYIYICVEKLDLSMIFGIEVIIVAIYIDGGFEDLFVIKNYLRDWDWGHYIILYTQMLHGAGIFNLQNWAIELG